MCVLNWRKQLKKKLKANKFHVFPLISLLFLFLRYFIIILKLWKQQTNNKDKKIAQKRINKCENKSYLYFCSIKETVIYLMNKIKWDAAIIYKYQSLFTSSHHRTVEKAHEREIRAVQFV